MLRTFFLIVLAYQFSMMKIEDPFGSESPLALVGIADIRDKRARQAVKGCKKCKSNKVANPRGVVGGPAGI